MSPLPIESEGEGHTMNIDPKLVDELMRHHGWPRHRAIEELRLALATADEPASAVVEAIKRDVPSTFIGVA